MYTFVIQGKRVIKIMDFTEGRIVSVMEEELAEGVIYQELLDDLAVFRERIRSGHYDYVPPRAKK